MNSLQKFIKNPDNEMRVLRMLDTSARSDIETFCKDIEPEYTTTHNIKHAWVNTNSHHDDDAAFVCHALWWCYARGMIIKHPTKPGWVRFGKAHENELRETPDYLRQSSNA